MKCFTADKICPSLSLVFMKDVIKWWWGGYSWVKEKLVSKIMGKKALWLIVLNFRKTGTMNMMVTQWFSQFPMITAGPKDRAGFMLAPV